MLQVFIKFGFFNVWLLILLVSATHLNAQNPVSLSMKVSSPKVNTGEKFTAQISASIGGGWHMYSITQGSGGPIPTRITVTDGVIKSAGTVKGSAPKREMDPNFGIMTEFYANSASFSVPLLVDSAAQPGAQNVEVKVRYQVCNDTTCLPPKTVSVTAAMEITAGTTVSAPVPSPGATVMKNVQSPATGFTAATIAAFPGLPIGPGGRPYLR